MTGPRAWPLTPVAFAAVAAVIACGTDERQAGENGAVGFELLLSRANVDEIGAFQLALVKNGSAHPCPELLQTCLVDQQLPTDELVRFEDSSGQTHVALTIPVDLTTSGRVRTQDTELRKVPIGKDYNLVIEALSKGSAPKLIGHSCTARIEVRAGVNSRILAEPIEFISPPQADGGLELDCDPRFEK